MNAEPELLVVRFEPDEKRSYVCNAVLRNGEWCWYEQTKFAITDTGERIPICGTHKNVLRRRCIMKIRRGRVARYQPTLPGLGD